MNSACLCAFQALNSEHCTKEAYNKMLQLLMTDYMSGTFMYMILSKTKIRNARMILLGDCNRKSTPNLKISASLQGGIALCL
jgi:hypothetical protein